MQTWAHPSIHTSLPPSFRPSLIVCIPFPFTSFLTLPARTALQPLPFPSFASRTSCPAARPCMHAGRPKACMQPTNRTCIQAYMHACFRACERASVRAYTRTYIVIGSHTPTYLSACMHCTHARTRMHLRASIQSCTRAHTHTQEQNSMLCRGQNRLNQRDELLWERFLEIPV